MVMTSVKTESKIFVNSRFVHVKLTNPHSVYLVEIDLRWLRNPKRLKQLFTVAFLTFSLDSVIPFLRSGFY